MTKAYKVKLGTKKFVVWADSPINVKCRLQAPYETPIQRLKEADDLQEEGTIMPWATYLQKEVTLEAKIQAAIVKELQSNGIFCHSIPNEQANGNPVRTGQLISMGMVPGVADLVIWLGKGRVAYMEVKNEVGKQSSRQVWFQEFCQKHGYPYRVVHSVEEAIRFYEECICSNGS